MQKFFPQNHMENFIQMHCLREIRIKPLNFSEKEAKNIYFEHKNRFFDRKQIFRQVRLFDFDLNDLDHF